MPLITSTEAGATPTGRYVNLGSPAVLDNLGTMTVLTYCYPTGGGGSTLDYVATKMVDGSALGWRLVANFSVGGGWNFGATSSGTVNFPSRKSATALTTNAWQHAAATWDGTVNASGITIYEGVGVPLAAAGSYSTSTDGTGSVVDDAAGNAYVLDRADLTRSFYGTVAYVAVWDRVLTLGELQTAQADGPLDVPTGLVLLWANEADLGPNAITPTARSTFAAGLTPPNLALGTDAPDTIARGQFI